MSQAPDDTPETGDTVIWIRTQATADGTYRPTLELSDDHGVVLTAEMAVQHCDYVLNRVASAVMQAKIYKQMTEMGQVDFEKGQAMSAQIISDFRQDEVVPESPTAFGLRAGVASGGRPFLVVSIDGKDVGQWDVDDAIDHATHCLMTVHVANNDALYLRLLRSLVGLDESTGRRVVSALADIDV